MQFASAEGYDQEKPEAEPKPWYRNPVTLTGWALLVMILIALIVYGIIELISDRQGTGNPSTTTPSTTTSTTTAETGHHNPADHHHDDGRAGHYPPGPAATPTTHASPDASLPASAAAAVCDHHPGSADDDHPAAPPALAVNAQADRLETQLGYRPVTNRVAAGSG